MENYEVFGELKFDVSKEVEAESHQNAIQNANVNEFLYHAILN